MGIYELRRQLAALEPGEFRRLLASMGYRITTRPPRPRKARSQPAWKGTGPEPDIEIRCACGCVWRGHAAVGNPVIELHRTGRFVSACQVLPATLRTDQAYRRRHPLEIPEGLEP